MLAWNKHASLLLLNKDRVQLNFIAWVTIKLINLSGLGVDVVKPFIIRR